MRPLAATYRKDGFLWTVRERVGDVALSIQEKLVHPLDRGEPTRFSVFIVQKNPAREIDGHPIEAAESMPGKEGWGRLGWTPSTEARAREIFAEQLAAQEERRTPEAKESDFVPSTPPAALRSCNRHDDCDSADLIAKAYGRWSAEHCHDECCEECFGS